jgi:putative peptidoglycan lipid II flippase
VLLAGPPEKGAFLLVAGMVAGNGAKILLLAPGYLRCRCRWSGMWFHPGLKEAAGMLGPVLLGAVLTAAHAAVLRAFASTMKTEGAVSHLTYAERIVAAPIDVFAFSLGTVLLPGLAAGAASGDREGMRRTVAKGLRLSVLLGLPAAAGLALVAEPLVALLLERGRFGGGDTEETARALRGYAPVLLFAGYTVLHQAFYALRRTGPILVSGGVGVGVTIGVAVALSRPLEVAGLTLAISAGTAASEAVLVGFLVRAIGRPDLGGVLGCAWRASLAAGGMALVVWSWTPHVLVRVAAGGAVFAALAGVLCREELGWLLPRRRRAGGDQPG